jgi:hypothetical protein
VKYARVNLASFLTHKAFEGLLKVINGVLVFLLYALHIGIGMCPSFEIFRTW